MEVVQFERNKSVEIYQTISSDVAYDIQSDCTSGIWPCVTTMLVVSCIATKEISKIAIANPKLKSELQFIRMFETYTTCRRARDT